MGIYCGYRIGDRVVIHNPSEKISDWRGTVVSVTFSDDGAPKHCRVEWTGTNSLGDRFVDTVGMEFFEIRLDPEFLDVPVDRKPETVERWLAS